MKANEPRKPFRVYVQATDLAWVDLSAHNANEAARIADNLSFDVFQQPFDCGDVEWEVDEVIEGDDDSSFSPIDERDYPSLVEGS